MLSQGPYSNVDSNAVGMDQKEWLSRSLIIRKYHELTHVICREMYPAQIHAVWDELVADAIGIHAAWGRYNIEAAKLFLGISGSAYSGGRLENYTDDPDRLSAPVGAVLESFEEIMNNHTEEESFSLIPLLQEQQSKYIAEL